MIIARYLAKELGFVFLGITTVLLLIGLSNRFVVFLAKVATGELPLGFVFRLVGLSIPELLSLLLPLSFFVAILFAYGRLHADSEITVLHASGYSRASLTKLTLGFSTLVTILVACLTLWWVPEIMAYRERTISEGEALAVIQNFVPGRFQTLMDGELVYYLEEVSTKEKKLKGVFIAEQPMKTKEKIHELGWSVIMAKEANLLHNNEKDEEYLVLHHGYRYQGIPGQANYLIIQFDEYGRALNKPESNADARMGLRQQSTDSLWRSNDPAGWGELEWRLSVPLSIPILTLIALPLAQVRPRQGRFAKLLPAVLIFIVYYNLFTLCKRWITAGSLSPLLGVWWVHLLFIGVGFSLMAMEQQSISPAAFLTYWSNYFWKNNFLKQKIDSWKTSKKTREKHQKDNKKS